MISISNTKFKKKDTLTHIKNPLIILNNQSINYEEMQKILKYGENGVIIIKLKKSKN